jgi:hypothetical protein
MKEYFRKPYMTQGISKHSDYMKAIPQRAIDTQGKVAPNIEFKKPYDYHPNTAQMIHYYANNLHYMGGDPVPPLNDPSLLPHAPVVETPTVTGDIILRPLVSTDDGYTNQIIGGTGSYTTNSTFLPIGFINVNYTYAIWIRFPKVSIPNGYDFSSAILKLIGHWDSGGADTCNLLIYAHAVSNSTVPTSMENFQALALTSRYIEWNSVQSIANVDYFTPNLAPIIKEVINRPLWVEGNALSIIIRGKEYPVCANYRHFASWDHGGQTPSLTIKV